MTKSDVLPGTRQGLKARPYVIEEYTRTVCPLCFSERSRRSDEKEIFKDGMLVSHDGSIWLRRFCRDHGETESLYEEDAGIWRARNGWGAPTLNITPDRADNFTGFPDGYRNGLPAGHGQHTCILLLNITERCNYACTTCYASAEAPGTPVPVHEHPDIEEISNTLQTVLEREGGKLGVLMLSGGEPTVRQDLSMLLDRLTESNITRIMINTNGRRIAKDDRFMEVLRKHRKKIEIYMQFDGLRDSTYQGLRGENLVNEKITALKRLNESGIFTTLVMTVKRGVNEDEVGDVVLLGVNTPYCTGMAIQPVFGSGRNLPFDPMDRATPTGVLQRLENQTSGLVGSSDFIPLPCSHKDCCDIAYLIQTADGTWKSLIKLLGKDELKKWIHLVSNTITFDGVSSSVKEMIQSGALQRVFSEQLKVGMPRLMGDIDKMCDCIPGLPQLLGGIWSMVNKRKNALEKLAQRTFRITCKMFMDSHTFHEARIRQCCVHTGTFEDNPRRYSFCWRWLFADASDAPDKPTMLKVLKAE